MSVLSCSEPQCNYDILCFTCSVDNDLATEPAAKRQRMDDAADETDFSMAAQAKGKVTEVNHHHTLLRYITAGPFETTCHSFQYFPCVF